MPVPCIFYKVSWEKKLYNNNKKLRNTNTYIHNRTPNDKIYFTI